MLTEIQIRACELFVQGENITNIAKKIGVSRPTVYEWLKKDEAKEKIDKLSDEAVREANRTLKNNINKYIASIEEIALNGNNEGNRLKASVYLVNRVLGNTSVNINQEIVDNSKAKEITWEDLDKIDGVTKFVV